MGFDGIPDEVIDHVENAGEFLLDHEFADSLIEIDKAEAMLAKFGDQQEALALKVACLDFRAIIYKEFDRMEESAKLSTEAVAIRAKLEYEDKMEQNDNYAKMAFALAELGQIDKAMEYADKVEDLYTFEMGLEGATSLQQLGEMYFRLPEQYYKKAKAAFIKSRNIYRLHLPECSQSIFQIQFRLAIIAHDYDHDDSQVNAECLKAWLLAESIGIENCDLPALEKIVVAAARLLGKEHKEFKNWRNRTLVVIGRNIDLGDAAYELVKYYVDGNVNHLVDNLLLNTSVTKQRVSRCVTITKNSCKEEKEYAVAQWLAGAALAHIGSGSEEDEKSVGLLKSAIKTLKTTENNELHSALIPVGEGYIGAYYFVKGEYQFSRKWYRRAMKHMLDCNVKNRDDHLKIFSDALVECARRIP
ncbi:MAG: hypothetical protein LBT59_26550 [Clostridiales bacterium]|jgi:tetratricopeptide (TPR) repeat protein|nr:hypothetical protein [Clostridiales bacterium]